MSELTDLDFTNDEALAFGYYRLARQFSHDPMMRLIDADARDKLAGYLTDKLVPDGATLNYSQMYWEARRTVSESVVYDVFGDRFASHVGYLVQRAWYPTIFKEETK